MRRFACLTVLRHWSALPIRSIAIGALVVLLAVGGPLACWLHCQRHATMLVHGSHYGQGQVRVGALAAWALPQASHHAGHVPDAPDGPAGVAAPTCTLLQTELTALTIGVLLLPLVLAIPHGRRWPCVQGALVVRHRVVPPLYPPPRVSFARAA